MDKAIKDPNVEVSCAFVNAGTNNCNIEDEIINYINEAESTIHILQYRSNSPAVFTALKNAYDRGILIYYCGDYHNEHLIDPSLLRIRIGPRKLKYHHKLIVIDGTDCIIGSYNLITENPVNNNVLFIKSSAFADECMEIWNMCNSHAEDSYHFFNKGPNSENRI